MRLKTLCICNRTNQWLSNHGPKFDLDSRYFDVTIVKTLECATEALEDAALRGEPFRVVLTNSLVRKNNHDPTQTTSGALTQHGVSILYDALGMFIPKSADVSINPKRIHLDVVYITSECWTNHHTEDWKKLGEKVYSELKKMGRLEVYNCG